MDMDWAKDIKPGDKVIEEGGFACPPRVAEVTKVTPTQIVIGNSRYRRKDGSESRSQHW